MCYSVVTSDIKTMQYDTKVGLHHPYIVVLKSPINSDLSGD